MAARITLDTIRHQLIPPFTVEAKMTAEVAATTTTQRLTIATL